MTKRIVISMVGVAVFAAGCASGTPQWVERSENALERAGEAAERGLGTAGRGIQRGVDATGEVVERGGRAVGRATGTQPSRTPAPAPGANSM